MTSGTKRKLKSDRGERSKLSKVTLEEIEGISTDDEKDDDLRHPKRPAAKSRRGIEMGADDDEEEEGELEARALRQAIMEGAFDKFKHDDDSESERDEDDHSDNNEEEEKEGDEEEEEDKQSENIPKESQLASSATSNINSKALLAKSEELSSRFGSNWVETFDIMSTDPLPFNDKYTKLDVHDDLKREVAFYNMALKAVHEAKEKCKAANVLFTRPDDFFAEMMKTDDHMAKVKDRLIFETKKISAFEQRKANAEHKLRAKEVRQHKTSEKNKRKKQHMEEVSEWAKSAAQNRGSARSDDEDKMFLTGMGKNPLEKSAKRQAMDKKYGYGGKKGKFKQMDKKTINDMSSFNPRGNFASGGMKKKSSMKKNKGAERPGKNKRMAAKQKKKN